MLRELQALFQGYSILLQLSPLLWAPHTLLQITSSASSMEVTGSISLQSSASPREKLSFALQFFHNETHLLAVVMVLQTSVACD